MCGGLEPEQKRYLRGWAEVVAATFTEAELYYLAGLLMDAGLDKDPDLERGEGA